MSQSAVVDGPESALPTPPTHPGPPGRDRRLHARQPVDRPGTVFRRSTLRYAAALTCDISTGGVLLELQTPRPVRLGEEVEVGIAWTRSPVISRAALVEGKVVRVTDLGDNRQRVAVEFANRAMLATAA
ncbi:MAG: PilZ domain-containing protein [Phycisphaerales bacterium]|nr:PilZ domain-containing protein [Phycisphaerales bacterium]